MPKYEVMWKELRYVKCVAEVVADTETQAIKSAQNYEHNVDEIEGDCFEQYGAFVKEIEED